MRGQRLSETATLNLNGSSGISSTRLCSSWTAKNRLLHGDRHRQPGTCHQLAGRAASARRDEGRCDEGPDQRAGGTANTAFTTTEKIEEELVKQLSDEISDCKVSIYDVKLMLDFGDGILIEAEENSFPAGGMDVWFDLPML